MDNIKSNFSGQMALISVLLIALSLRLIGIEWGVPSAPYFLPALHPDEQWGISVLAEMNWAKGDYNPDRAHWEGTLSAYLWSGYAWALLQLGVIDRMPWELQGYDQHYGAILFHLRIFNVALDVGSCLLVYLITLRLSRDRISALLAALIYAIIPFGVIYAHYLRTHVVSNFFVLVAIFFSLRLYENGGYLRYVFIGILCGLAGASRYPVVFVLVVPGIIFLSYLLGRIGHHGLTLKNAAISLVKFTVLIMLGTTVGFFLGDPIIFLDFEAVKPQLLHMQQYVDGSQFLPTTLLSLGKISSYIFYLIPYGTLPLLWAVFYLVLVYLLFCKSIYRFTLPLLCVALVFFVGMAKGYTASVVFVRAIFNTFPAVAILTGLAFWHFRTHYKHYRILNVAVISLIGLSIISSTLFDIAYVRAMSRKDPREHLHEVLLKETDKLNRPLRVGVLPHGHNYFTLSPAFANFGPEKIHVIQGDDFINKHRKLDYLVLVSFEAPTYGLAEIGINALINSGKYKDPQVFKNQITFLGFEFDNRNFPHDMQYPIPTLYLMKRVR